MSISEAPATAERGQTRPGVLVDPVLIAGTAFVLGAAALLASRLDLELLILVAAFVAGWSSAWSP